jgi:dTDP-4-amino-4,6-dideoxygalactose transaminase
VGRSRLKLRCERPAGRVPNAQLEEREEIQCARERIWRRYWNGLAGWAQQNGVRLPVVPGHCEQSYHMFYLQLASLERRQALIAHLKPRGTLAVFHYVPLHLSGMGMKLGAGKNECAVTVDVSERLLRLPFYNGLSENEQDEVIEGCP